MEEKGRGGEGWKVVFRQGGECPTCSKMEKMSGLFLIGEGLSEGNARKCLDPLSLAHLFEVNP